MMTEHAYLYLNTLREARTRALNENDSRLLLEIAAELRIGIINGILTPVDAPGKATPCPEMTLTADATG